MTVKRDNDEERMTRIEHILARVAENRAGSERIQEQAHQVLSELYSSKERRIRLVESVNEILQRKSGKKQPQRVRKRFR